MNQSVPVTKPQEDVLPDTKYGGGVGNGSSVFDNDSIDQIKWKREGACVFQFAASNNSFAGQPGVVDTY